MSSLEHLGRRDLLVVCWHYILELIGSLPTAAQWELHRLYALSRDLSDNEFLDRMRQVLEAEPTLVQRAGKHYAQIFTTFKRYADLVGKDNWDAIRRLVIQEFVESNGNPTERRQIVVMPLVNPEPDVQKLARLFLERARRTSRSDFA